ncbi:Holliday junction DNA helicase RuvB C-terminal domain-containing protein, partial [Mesorhizobium sp. M2D.F.Ca.ET.148.01.1.1]|uniref:Holliday junction DNA helicase RuvB C-terminal domain-containing protein n=1 Tax=Mesorhizobium sp. M2D.F.Ca.ET.148.01.1.1 TaxID=2496665 RepID=UPI001259B819
FNLRDEGAREVARRARCAPRSAGRLRGRVRDFAEVARAEAVTRDIADEALTRLLVDNMGLDQLDMRYLTMIAVNFGGAPVGIVTIAAGLSEPRAAIEDITEPYMIQQGFIQRT